MESDIGLLMHIYLTKIEQIVKFLIIKQNAFWYLISDALWSNQKSENS